MRGELTHLSGLMAVALAVVAGPACAQNFNLPWCGIVDTNGTTQCTYYTQQECLETMSGLGGECIANPNAGTPTLAPSTPPPGAILGPPADLDPGPPPGLDGAVGPGPPPY